MSIVQSVLIPKDKYTIKQGQNWLRKHNFIYDNIDTTFPNYVHYRQVNPALLTKYSYITKVLPNGMQLAIAVPKKKKIKGGGLLEEVKKNLKKYKIPYDKVELSPKKDKKIRLWVNGKPIDYGLKTSQTWIEGASETKKNSYQARASKITNKNQEYTYKIRYTPNFLSFLTLWN